MSQCCESPLCVIVGQVGELCPKHLPTMSVAIARPAFEQSEVIGREHRGEDASDHLEIDLRDREVTSDRLHPLLDRRDLAEGVFGDTGSQVASSGRHQLLATREVAVYGAVGKASPVSHLLDREAAASSLHEELGSGIDDDPSGGLCMTVGSDG